ncbi:MAG: Type III pantothenate kinase [Myxococcota bacterium]|nr:Type III pantothenate kinase [Myxococcota bacterium]
MLLAVDVGNTNIVAGVFDGARLMGHWRLSSSRNRTGDEYTFILRGLLRDSGVDPEKIDGAIISNVVPPIQRVLEEMIQNAFGLKSLVVGPGIKTGMQILYDNPREVGADRIVNAVAAYEEYQQACIVVDFGTATTFDAVNSEGAYMGGAIAPGIGISMEALFQRASKLPRVELTRPPHVIGRNTVTSMQAGLLYGYVGQVDEIVRRMKAEMDTAKLTVVATGGLAQLVSQESTTINKVSPFLTLEGLRILYNRNQRSTP